MQQEGPQTCPIGRLQKLVCLPSSTHHIHGPLQVLLKQASVIRWAREQRIAQTAALQIIRLLLVWMWSTTVCLNLYSIRAVHV
jgi:hypothetical protein